VSCPYCGSVLIRFRLDAPIDKYPYSYKCLVCNYEHEQQPRSSP
jgi:DNA-directed RNA polymerase subunit RPC12/RpoP